ncbi:MAG: 4-(cytidine 5'-diphospho)-2-C-methyl-D-erythritol kinase [Gemmataceae bacterium]
MIFDRLPKKLVVWAPAKVNLFLEILGKRPDGYHEIATLMVAVSLYDTLEFKEGNKGETHLLGNAGTLSFGPDNLIHRVVDLVRQRTKCDRGIDITLTKRIPIGGGLAGGSTNAAATFLALNEVWDLGMTLDQLVEWSAELGSDIPFFFRTPAAWCTGRGEKVQPIKLSQRLWLVLLCPPVEVSTAEVYRRLVVPQVPHDETKMLAAVREGTPESIARELHNRLELSAVQVCPDVLSRAKGHLAETNPAGYLLSGSGSTFFALCHGPDEAKRVARELRDGEGLLAKSKIYVVRTCSV